MNDCQVIENCQNYKMDRDQCWMCEDYSLYIPEDKKILSPAQIKRKEERKAEKARLKASEASKRGRSAKRKGAGGEYEVVKLLSNNKIKSERVPLSGALKTEKYSCDVTCEVGGEVKRIEVKRRKQGLKTLKNWLEEDIYSNYVFFREDYGDWIVSMKINEFVDLIHKIEEKKGEQDG